jgi:SAM-dependent methyltransferase
MESTFNLNENLNLFNLNENLFTFINLSDVIQFFANEWCQPKNNILIIESSIFNENYKNLFNFINCEIFIITNSQNKSFVDFVVDDYSQLPFEEHSFDVIINLSYSLKVNFVNLKLYLKENGVLLTNEFILNARDYYKLNLDILTVI